MGERNYKIGNVGKKIPKWHAANAPNQSFNQVEEKSLLHTHYWATWVATTATNFENLWSYHSRKVAWKETCNWRSRVHQCDCDRRIPLINAGVWSKGELSVGCAAAALQRQLPCEPCRDIQSSIHARMRPGCVQNSQDSHLSTSFKRIKEHKPVVWSATDSVTSNVHADMELRQHTGASKFTSATSQMRF